ncbi:MAG: ribonuclease P protein component [Holophagaceae bacterium]|nr:ribonuclease P protein component [Holophagaceae bacterium]
MRVAGRFRVVRRGDSVFADGYPKHLSARGNSLDIRCFPWEKCELPLLLVSASKKTGSAVERNKFRRRARMAFLAVLRNNPHISANSFVFWVRPARENPTGCRVEYNDIENQIESSLKRMSLT